MGFNFGDERAPKFFLAFFLPPNFYSSEIFGDLEKLMSSMVIQSVRFSSQDPYKSELL